MAWQIAIVAAAHDEVLLQRRANVLFGLLAFACKNGHHSPLLNTYWNPLTLNAVIKHKGCQFRHPKMRSFAQRAGECLTVTRAYISNPNHNPITHVTLFVHIRESGTKKKLAILCMHILCYRRITQLFPQWEGIAKMNNGKMRYLASASAGVLLTVGMQSAVLAQDDTANADDDFSTVFEEIIVTARRTEENLQFTPIAVTAITARGMEARGFQDVADITRITPNLVFDTASPVSGNPAAPSVFIRGVGQLDFTINADPGVGIYVDGVYVARSVGGLVDLLDLERVEVLRGPQGTLFGRNTIGGAIQLVSKKPQFDDVDGYATGTVGTSGRFEFQGAVNIPLSETVAVKFSGLKKQQDGYIINALGQDLGDDNSYSLRGQIRFTPSDHLDINLSVDYTEGDENGAANVALTGYPNGALPYRFNTGPNFGCNAPDAGLTFLPNRNLDTSTASYSTYIAHVDANPDSCFGLNALASEEGTTNSNLPSLAQNKIFGTSATIEYSRGEISLKSITAYRAMDAKFQRDSDHTQFHIFDTINHQNQDQFSQEINLSGQHSRFNWLGGFYYFKENAQGDTNIILPAGSRALLIRGIFDNRVENRNWALFGEATYEVSDRFRLTGGVRYTEEDKLYDTNQFFGFTGSEASPIYDPEGYDIVTPADYSGPVLVTLVDDPNAEISISDTTIRLTVAYDVSDKTFVYGTYSQGFKSGGFNPRYLAPTGLGNADTSDDLRAIRYDPEFVEMFEIGAKFSIGSNFRLNVAAFTTDYTDVQVSASTATSNGARVTSNAAKATIKGLEAEMLWIPSSNFVVEASMGILDADYKEFGATVDFACLPSCKLPRIPSLTASLGFSYNFGMKNGASLVPRLDLSYKSAVEGDANNAPQIEHPSQNLASASVAFNSANDAWTVSAGVSNLLNEDYVVSSNNNPRLSYSEVVFGRGREAYMSLKYRF